MFAYEGELDLWLSTPQALRTTNFAVGATHQESVEREANARRFGLILMLGVSVVDLCARSHPVRRMRIRVSSRAEPPVGVVVVIGDAGPEHILPKFRVHSCMSGAVSDFKYSMIAKRSSEESAGPTTPFPLGPSLNSWPRLLLPDFVAS